MGVWLFGVKQAVLHIFSFFSAAKQGGERQRGVQAGRQAGGSGSGVVWVGGGRVG